ncbi:hypothetical protein SCHPADRAFT_948251 [Schizopora paradoxa]|uniref:Uncharacterized protein n=1 Tax=Schizopora paradoxa TaxID=27342 RepID=A0A0H2QX02_9AGAM|nr:hypothetical protein SCHPADRAFT_948251 [Schizopora paradoxa]
MRTHFVLGALLATLVHVLIGFLRGREALHVATTSSSEDLSPGADVSPLPVLPPFVNEKDLLKAQAITSWGYECFDSLPRVFKRAPKDIADIFGVRVKEIKSTGASICRAQRELSRALVDSVEECVSPLHHLVLVLTIRSTILKTLENLFIPSSLPRWKIRVWITRSRGVP